MIAKIKKWIDEVFDDETARDIWWATWGACWACTIWAWFGNLIPYSAMWFERAVDPIILIFMSVATVRKILKK